MGSEKTVPPLLLEDVARAAAELTAERELEALLARFQDHLREWWKCRRTHSSPIKGR